MRQRFDLRGRSDRHLRRTCPSTRTWSFHRQESAAQANGLRLTKVPRKAAQLADRVLAGFSQIRFWQNCNSRGDVKKNHKTSHFPTRSSVGGDDRLKALHCPTKKFSPYCKKQYTLADFMGNGV
jgi:hypothetical protein